MRHTDIRCIAALGTKQMAKRPSQATPADSTGFASGPQQQAGGGSPPAQHQLPTPQVSPVGVGHGGSHGNLSGLAGGSGAQQQGQQQGQQPGSSSTGVLKPPVGILNRCAAYWENGGDGSEPPPGAVVAGGVGNCGGAQPCIFSCV